MLKRACLLAVCLASLAPAALVRIELGERSDVLGGKSFGAAGPYERLIGKAYFAVDPANPANRSISDIDKAPRNEKGLVEFSADLYVLTPRDPARGNHAVLFEVSNRGTKGMLSMYNRAAGSLDPRTAEQFGDEFLLERGFTLVWLGWQFDVPRRDGLMRLYAPVAHDGDRPITGLVRSEFVLDRAANSYSLADRDHIPYAAVNPDDPKLTLTVRDWREGARRPVPRDDWHIEDRTRVMMPAGFEMGKIYELVYTAQDPVLVGLGPTAIRDLISFLKYGGNDATVLGDAKNYVKRAYGFGISQSGRFLRTFLYYGFNRDEHDRQVFDGVLSHVAGAARGSFNFRFAQPSRDAHPFYNMFYPTDIFPFTDLEETDPETGLADGLLVRAAKDKVVPKIFYTNSAYEYWGRSASLIHIAIDGQKDATIPDTTRIYFLAGGQHGPASFPPPKNHTQNLTNPNDYRWAMRALLVDMDRWAAEGKEPPASQYPRIAQDTLVPLGAVQFPKIPGVALPTHVQQAYRVDYGPEFRTAGIITIEPPKVGHAFPILLPQVNQDGNETAGLRMPELQVPLATYTGWNLRSADIGAPGELNSMQGSFIPFPRTKADRELQHDPRPSIEERYAGRSQYLEKIEEAARKLASGGYLLEADIPKVVDHSATEWDYLVGAR
ncbi:MAG TPA: alpha/beta hydrolase domain-containing protein [Bryobacteraceae bacterium]|nr:alpha/beta hydrolase domain-containing protein [Bryobacteraceae bacterium]